MELLQKFRQREPDSPARIATQSVAGGSQLTLKFTTYRTVLWLRRKFQKIKSLFVHQKTTLADGFIATVDGKPTIASQVVSKYYHKTSRLSNIKKYLRGPDGIRTHIYYLRGSQSAIDLPAQFTEAKSLYQKFLSVIPAPARIDTRSVSGRKAGIYTNKKSGSRIPSARLRAGKYGMTIVLIISLLISQLTSIFIPNVYAASSPWTQTDWSGGSGQTSWLDATKFDSSSSIDTTTTSGEVSLSVVENFTNTGFDSDNSSWSVAAVPASGWIEVPGNATFSTTNFLAMKYEAKCAATSDLTTGLTAPENSSYNTYDDGTTACTSANSKAVVSVASGYPIANISHTNAVTRCGTVSLNSNAAHLLRNDEYMTIARNAEAQTGNWTLGSVGSGYLFAGHNDNAPAKARIASTTDTGNNRCAYTDTAGTTEAPSSCPSFTAADQSDDVGNQVRTFTLSNSAVIWDIAGNVWEHVARSTDNAGDTTTNMASLPSCSNGTAGWEWCQYGSTTTPYVSAWTSDVAVAKVGSATTSYNASQGMGQVYSYGSGAGQSTSVFLR